MNIPKDCIIIGGGISIIEGTSLGLKEKIKDKCIFLTNYSYKHFEGTILCFTDKDFYVPDYAKRKEIREKYPDIYNELKNLPLIIGLQKNNGMEEFLHPNTYLIDCPKKELTKKPPLTGIFALTIAEKIGFNRMWLLGFDWSRQPIPKDKTKYNSHNGGQIHYYNDIKHKGTGYTGYFDIHNPNDYFKFFDNSKIYNVSLNSNIQNFKKISYQEMFQLLDNKIYNQNELRDLIKKIILL